MRRPKRHQTAADLDAEIRRLEAERQRLLDAEDQRRGVLIREYLSAPNGDALREALRDFVSDRDGALFGLGTAPAKTHTTERRPRTSPVRAALDGATVASPSS